MASPLQFSVRQLLIAVAFLAIGITALQSANSVWMSAIWGVVPLSLAVAILLILYRRDEVRAYWVGFAVFGWLYFGIVLLAYWPVGNAPHYGPGFGPHAPLAYYQLWTARITDWAYTKIIPESARTPQIPDPEFQVQGAGGAGGVPATPGMPGMGSSGMMPGGMPGSMMGGMGDMMPGFGPPVIANPDYVDPSNFQQIGHALWLLLLAAVGGKLAQWIYRTRPKQATTTA